MERILHVWKQRTVVLSLPLQDQMSIVQQVDMVVTTQKLVFVLARYIRDITGGLLMVGLVTGPLGMLVTGTVAALWEKYKNSEAKMIDPDVIPQLVRNGVAFSTDLTDLRCTIADLRCSFLVGSCACATFHATFAYRDRRMEGGISITGDSPKKLAMAVENVLPIKVEMSGRRSLDEWSTMTKEGKAFAHTGWDGNRVKLRKMTRA